MEENVWGFSRRELKKNNLIKKKYFFYRSGSQLQNEQEYFWNEL